MAAPLPDSDGDLVLLALEGRQDAFSALYERYFQSIFDFLTRLLRNREEAADVAQDTFIKALEQLGNLKNPDRFKSWLFTIAHRTGLNRIRSSKRTTVVGGVDDDERATMAVADPDPTADPEQMAATQEAADIVWEAAALLDPRTYAVMDLHVRQGLDSAEIAEVMGVTKGNAYTMVSRMKQSFSSTLATYLLVRKGRQDCDDLAGIVEPDVAKMTPELRRKADRHVAKCSVCSDNKALYFEPVKLFAALMLVPLPAGLKASIWDAVVASGAAARGSGEAGDTTTSPARTVGSSAASASPMVFAAIAAVLALVLAIVVGGFFATSQTRDKVTLAAPALLADGTELQPGAVTSNGPNGIGTTIPGEAPGDPLGSPTSTTTAALPGGEPPGTIAPDDDAIAFDDNMVLDEDQSLSFDVTANDAEALDDDSLIIASGPSRGSARAGSSGVITYTPDRDFAGTDQFTYSIADDRGRTGSAVVTIVVRQVNDEPTVPGPGVLALDEDTAATFAPLAGASDVDGDDLTVSSFDTTSREGGSVTASGGRYTPPADFAGVDSYSYTVSDGTARVTVTVAVSVAATPDAPRPPSGGVTATVAEDGSATFNALSGWTDPDGDTLTVTAGTFTTAKGGTVVVAANGTATYTGPLNFSGVDTFTFKVSDGTFSVTGTATITVVARNDAPTVQNATFNLNAGAAPGTIVGRVTASDPDPGDTLTYAITAGNTSNQMKINSTGDVIVNAITNPSAFPLSLTVRVTDGGGLTDTATVTVRLIDNAGPSISNFVASPTTIYAYAAPGVACPSGASNSRLSATVTDPSGISSVSFAYTGTISGQVFSGTVPGTMSGSTASGNFAIVINGFPFTSADFTFTIYAEDGSGNSTVVGGVTVTVLPCP